MKKKILGIIAGASLVFLAGCGTDPLVQAEKAYMVGNYQSAISYYEQAQLKNGESYAVCVGLGKCYADQGHIDKALGYFEKAEGLMPAKKQELAVMRAELYYKAGDYKRSMADVKYLIKQGNMSPLLTLLKAKNSYKMKNYEAAVPAYNEVFKLYADGSKESVAAAKEMAICLFNLKKYDEAYKVFFTKRFKYVKPALRDDSEWYMAGALYRVTLQEDKCQEMWKNLSTQFKMQKGIK